MFVKMFVIENKLIIIGHIKVYIVLYDIFLLNTGYYRKI